MDDPFGPTPPPSYSPNASDDPFGPAAPFGRSRLRNDARIWAEKARTLFNNHPQYRAESPRSNYNAILMRVIHDEDDGRSKRFLVKAAYPEVAGFVRNDSVYLNRLRNAKHIVNIVTLRDDPMNPTGVSTWQHPYVFMEYLENGTVVEFQRRIVQWIVADGTRTSLVLPNRLLWAIFTCLIRACVAMAWPPSGPNIQLEVPLEHEPQGLAHCDMHGGNIMFGDIDTREEEHSRVPILKLIDFGEAQMLKDQVNRFPLDSFSMNRFDIPLNLASHRPATGRRNQATDRNLIDVGCTMSRIIASREFAFIPDCRRFIQDPAIHPNLDPDLRLLIQRCLAVDPLNRPRLEELIPFLAQNIKTESDYRIMPGYNGSESNDAMNYFISRCILDANTNAV